MLMQNLFLILTLLISEVALVLICNRLKLQFAKIAFTICIILLLIFIPIYYFNNHFVVSFLKLLFKNQPGLYRFFGITMTNSMSFTLNCVFIMSYVLVGLVFIMLVALLVEIIKASCKLINFIRELFKSKSKQTKIVIENYTSTFGEFLKAKWKKIYLKFCRLLN